MTNDLPKISICSKDNCMNVYNVYENCEEFLDSRIPNITLESLEKLYHKLCQEFWLTLIHSTTSINWESAQEHLMDRIIFEIIWCRNFSEYINKLRHENGNWNWDFETKITKSDIQRKVRNILYWRRGALKKILEVASEFGEKYDSDIFVNILIKLDNIYKLSIIIDYMT